MRISEDVLDDDVDVCRADESDGVVDDDDEKNVDEEAVKDAEEGTGEGVGDVIVEEDAELLEDVLRDCDNEKDEMGEVSLKVEEGREEDDDVRDALLLEDEISEELTDELLENEAETEISVVSALEVAILVDAVEEIELVKSKECDGLASEVSKEPVDESEVDVVNETLKKVDERTNAEELDGEDSSVEEAMVVDEEKGVMGNKQAIMETALLNPGMRIGWLLICWVDATTDSRLWETTDVGYAFNRANYNHTRTRQTIV